MSFKKVCGSMIAILIIVGMVATACGPTTEPEVIERVVTEVVTVKETVVVEGTPVIVEKEVTREVTSVPEATTPPEEPAEGAPKYGGILRYGATDPRTWTPYNTSTCVDETIMAQIWSGLVRYNAQSEIVADLAESWEWQDNTTLIFNLRKNVQWHNGDPLIADHVVQSMTLRQGPDTILRERMEDVIDKWETIDDYTVKLTLLKPYSPILRMLTPSPGHGVVLHPDWDPATSGQSPEATIGTGPFMFESYDPGISVNLVRNPNYFIEGMPYLDGFRIVIIDDSEARLTSFRAGSLDMVENLDMQQVTLLRGTPDVELVTTAGFYGSRLLLELTLAPTDDVKVRHALNYAVDRETIVEAAIGGEGEPCWGSLIPEGSFGYAPELANYYSYDPDKAMALLDEAGWTEIGPDGIRVKDGRRLTVVFATYGPSWWSQTGEIVQANLRSIGVECELEVTPWADYSDKRQRNANLPLGEEGFINIIGGTIWGVSIGDFLGYVSGSFNRYHNTAAQELIFKAFASIDVAEQEMYFREAQALVMDDAPWIAPAWIERGEAIHSHVKGFQRVPETACWGIQLFDVWLDK